MLEVLVVDNHDSFTWNLVDYLESNPGVRCRVVANDEPGWSTDDLAGVDAVVLSPGPGHPADARDFGLCRDVLDAVRSTAIPTLGVCLGHQGLCLAYGADIEPYDDPYHGRRSEIRHDGSSPLFRGVPLTFDAVRYHSLTARGVHAPLRVIARFEEMVMAVEHETLPLYGVQFHPESAASTHGRRILANFLTIAMDCAASRNATPLVGGSRTISSTITFDGDLSMLHEEFAGTAPSYLLESAAPRLDEPMRSFVGVCGPHWAQAVADPSGFTLESAKADRVVQGDLLDWVDGHVEARRLRGRPEVARWALALPYALNHDDDHPTRALFCDRTMSYDHATGRLLLQAECDDTTQSAADAWIDAVTARSSELSVPGCSPLIGRRPEKATSYRLEWRDQSVEYMDKVTAAQKYIRSGESYELCLTTGLRVVGDSRPHEIYRSLRAASPSFFAAHLSFGDCSIISSSPERFLSIHDDRCVTEPIKGTRPRGATPEDDLAQRNDLTWSEKDRAENLMIVDLARNDLRQVSVPGSVVVERLFDVEAHPTVHQMTSSISSILRPSTPLSDVVAATFPPGSMTGAPKTRSMELLSELEAGFPRGYYSGAIGHLASDGRLDLSVVIRAVIDDGTTMTYGVGGAVTALSEPHAELAEIHSKASALAQALGCSLPT